MTIFPDLAIPFLSGAQVPMYVNPFGAAAGRYRLALYPELGRKDRSVLVIGTTLQFQFKDGDSGLKWGAGEQKKFADDAVAAIKSVWDDKWRITTTSTAVRAPFRDVGVIFVPKTYINGTHIDDDFEVVVKKIPRLTDSKSEIRAPLGNAWLDSEDLYPAYKGDSIQRPVVHEFGHMLGLKDEYDRRGGSAPNPNWLSDKQSIMHSGERVRPRHYVPFATWLTRQLATVAKLTTRDVSYKVDGMWDASNARL